MESLPPEHEREERPEAVPRWYGPYRPFLGSPPPRPWHPPTQVAICVALFVATAFSTALTNGPAYAGAVMVILLSHELGHYFMCRRYRVRSTLPFFIPFFPAAPAVRPVASPGVTVRNVRGGDPDAATDREPQGGLRHRHRRAVGRPRAVDRRAGVRPGALHAGADPSARHGAGQPRQLAGARSGSRR